MKAIAIMEKTIDASAYARDTVIQFEEGLVGFSDCKSFVLVENSDIAPFRRLQSAERPEVGFLVIDPCLIVADYGLLIPRREWASLGVAKPGDGIALAICIIGPGAAERTGNLQAPVLVNHSRMIGKQIILTETGLNSRHPLL